MDKARIRALTANPLFRASVIENGAQGIGNLGACGPFFLHDERSLCPCLSPYVLPCPDFGADMRCFIIRGKQTTVPLVASAIGSSAA
jgi:hypothetical protein